MSEHIQPNDRARMVRGRVQESIRLARRSRNPKKPKVIAYFRYVFTDSRKFLGEVSCKTLNIYLFLFIKQHQALTAFFYRPINR